MVLCFLSVRAVRLCSLHLVGWALCRLNFDYFLWPGDDGRLTRPMRVAFLLAKLGGAFAANLLSDLHLGTAGLNI
ncbi:hypothetical protein U1Q18_007554 [Sarracenia purpurea var. burkii]